MELVTKGYFDLKLAERENRIILKICALLIAQSGIIVALIKLL